jgi:hypothetical protein
MRFYVVSINDDKEAYSSFVCSTTVDYKIQNCISVQGGGIAFKQDMETLPGFSMNDNSCLSNTKLTLYTCQDVYQEDGSRVTFFIGSRVADHRESSRERGLCPNTFNHLHKYFSDKTCRIENGFLLINTKQET